jgi:CubicO group peptidase (beta-lactamase class C family)
MERAVADQKIAGGIVMVSHNGKIGFFHTYGQMDREAKKPMSPDTIFRIYSMSKAITTAAALYLYDAGKIGLDDPVSKYIPSFANLKVAGSNGLRPPTRPMTVRDLMLHTSGLTYGDGPDALKEAYGRLKPMESTNLKEMAEKLSQVPLAFDPGTDWNYGVGIDVLGRVIEVASGENLDLFLEKNHFQTTGNDGYRLQCSGGKKRPVRCELRPVTRGLKVLDVPSESKFAQTSHSLLWRRRAGEHGQRLHAVPFDDRTRRDFRRASHPAGEDGQTDDLQPASSAGIPDSFWERKALRHRVWPRVLCANRNHELGPGGHVGEYGWGGAASTHYWPAPWTT